MPSIHPILPTATSTVVGMLPIVLGTTLGLERMLPLGTATGFGLFVGRILTFMAAPVTYTMLGSSPWCRVMDSVPATQKESE